MLREGWAFPLFADHDVDDLLIGLPHTEAGTPVSGKTLLGNVYAVRKFQAEGFRPIDSPIIAKDPLFANLSE